MRTWERGRPARKSKEFERAPRVPRLIAAARIPPPLRSIREKTLPLAPMIC